MSLRGGGGEGEEEGLCREHRHRYSREVPPKHAILVPSLSE